MNTKAKGNISEAKALARFVALGWVVLLPFGDNEPYDLVIDRGEGFERVQVKTARLAKNGCLMFNAHSTIGRVGNGTEVHYRGRIDWFAVVSERLDKVYMIPVEDVGTSTPYLRLTAPKIRNPKVRLANEYEI